MGSFVYMIARDDADIIEEKRPEFEERLEKVFNAAGMMEQEHLTLFGKGIRALRPVRIENGYTTFFYNILKMMYGKTQDITTKTVAFTQKRLAGGTLRVL